MLEFKNKIILKELFDAIFGLALITFQFEFRKSFSYMCNPALLEIPVLFSTTKILRFLYFTVFYKYWRIDERILKPSIIKLKNHSIFTLYLITRSTESQPLVRH